MAIANPNVVTSWARDQFNQTTGATGPLAPLIDGVIAHAAIIPSTAFHELPASARKTSYVFQVDSGIDLATGDYLIAAIDLRTKQPWPADYPWDPSMPGFTNTLWIVRYHQESTPGPAGYRALYVEKIILGGPTSPFG